MLPAIAPISEALRAASQQAQHGFDMSVAALRNIAPTPVTDAGLEVAAASLATSSRFAISAFSTYSTAFEQRTFDAPALTQAYFAAREVSNTAATGIRSIADSLSFANSLGGDQRAAARLQLVTQLNGTLPGYLAATERLHQLFDGVLALAAA